VHFGTKVYRDGIDITCDELYSRLDEETEYPTTSQPSPGDFTKVYDKLANDADEILSIHVSSKLSGTYNSALQGKATTRIKSRIVVFDSEMVTMGMGLATILAAKMAQSGHALDDIISNVKQALYQTRVFAMFESLKYLQRGGRIGRAKALIGGFLSVKPMLTLKDGEIHPVGFVRTRSKGIEKLVDQASKAVNPEVAIIHSTTPLDATALRDRIEQVAPESKTYISRLGPALGVHGGPGALVLGIMNKTSQYDQKLGKETREKDNSSLS
jgi:DegV family protein with EDD domain